MELEEVQREGGKLMDNNEERADMGYQAVMAATGDMGTCAATSGREPASTCITDTLAYLAHLCDRFGLDPKEAFDRGLRSYKGDFEDGPPAERRHVNPEEPFARVGSA